MAAKVEIISKEMIKPSFPTDPTLRTHTLSFLDQIASPIFIRLIFFYEYGQLENIINRAEMVQKILKQSLSDVLTRFYPLAGRVNGNSCIDCNDAGVDFIEAHVYDHLSKVLENPKIEELGVLLPSDNKDVLLAVQVNSFDCEGIAIGVQMSHKVGDFSSMVTFINAWAATARGDIENIVQPNFKLTSNMFKPLDLPNSIYNHTNEKFLVRRFVFNKEKLDVLKKSVRLESQVKDPTRVEALSSIIWKNFIDNSKSKKFTATQAVNLRTRMSPTLSNHTFGNLNTNAVAPLPNQENYDLVRPLRSAVRKIDSDYISKTLQNGEQHLKDWGKLLSTGGVDHEFYNFTSWCRFPVYETDFGWGKPIRVCTTTVAYTNFTIFLDTKCGEGIEAYVNMVEEGGFSEALSRLVTPEFSKVQKSAAP